jgi:hypothetical protein
MASSFVVPALWIILSERMFYDKPVKVNQVAYVRDHFRHLGVWTGWRKTRILWIRVGKSGDTWRSRHGAGPRLDRDPAIINRPG